MSKPSVLRRILSAIWNGITRLRMALSNILFLLMLVVIYLLFAGEGEPPLPERAALLLNPTGVVVDQKSQVEPLQALMGESSPAEREVLLRDMIDAIDFATDDPAINSLVMELDLMMHIGISKTGELVRSLEAFKASGKPVIAVGDYYSQDQYLLASYADTVIMHPYGAVGVEGFASYGNYFREALAKLSVNMHVFKAGEHKALAEPFLRDDMSPDEKVITERWLQQLWAQYTAIVETQRELEPGAINDYVNNYATAMAEFGGDSASLAQRKGLVDKILNRDEANDYLVETVGASDEDGLYEAMMFDAYVARKRPSVLIGTEAERVAVITAQGNILPGEQPAGTIGGDSLASLISSTAGAEGVRAIVLRVNSGGGSVFASEVIRQQVLKVRAQGIPVVISMGAIAASGGYYIAAEADEIWATPSTITGSIGVFAAFPTFDRLLQRMGIYTDGVGTTDLAGSLRLDRPLNPELADALASGVQFNYGQFVKLVAQGRDLDLETASTLAQGQVWGAPDALDLKLVDKLGGLEDAIASAATRVGLKDYEVEYVELPRSTEELLLQRLAERVGSINGWSQLPMVASLVQLLAPVTEAAAELASLQDPRHLYMRCISCGMVP